MILHDQIWLESINYPLKDLDAEKPPANPANCLVETQNELVSCRVLTSTNHPRLTQWFLVKLHPIPFISTSSILLRSTQGHHWLGGLEHFSAPARWGLLDFIRAVLLLLRLLCLLRLLTRRLLLAVQIPVGTAGPPPRAPDCSGHCRTSTASCRSQWALPDLNRDFQVAVGSAGPQPRLPDRSGHCRTSTATSRSQWALPDLNGKNVRKDVR